MRAYSKSKNKDMKEERGKRSFYLHSVPEALSPRVKWLGPEAHHSPPSSVEVKNDGALSPLTHVSMPITVTARSKT
jgi:hypothetical protein